MEAIKFERTQIHFFRDVFTAVVVAVSDPRFGPNIIKQNNTCWLDIKRIHSHGQYLC